MRRQPYADRDEAGRVLASALAEYAGRADVLVLGLPRGGAPVAAQVASALGADLDVLVVRKVGVPGHPELAMGAVAGVGGAVEVVRNNRVLERVAVPAADFDAVLQREVDELRRRERAYRGDSPPQPMSGRVVVVVDDGLATGSAMRAAAAAVRRHQPSRLVAAVPVGARESCRVLSAEVDEVVCAWTPWPFSAVSQAYWDFRATSDEEVRRALSAGHARPDRPPDPTR